MSHACLALALINLQTSTRVVPDPWLETTFQLSQSAPVQTWDFQHAAARAAWTPNAMATVTGIDLGMAVETNGGDPFLTHRLAQPLRPPLAVGIVFRQPEEWMYLDLYVAGPGESFGARGNLRRLVAGSDQWQTVWFWVEGGEVQQLRLDPPGGRHRLEIARMEIFQPKPRVEAGHPELPKPTFRNTAYVVPIHESYDDRRYDDASRRRDIAQLKEEIGPGRLYLRTGFSASSPKSWNKDGMMKTVGLLEEAGLVWHVHHHVGNHSIGRYPWILEAVKKDRRNAAWSVDGSCRGVAKSWDDPHVFNEEGLARTSVLVCISPLNRDVVAARREAARWLNEDQGHAQAAREHPETMISAGCSVENELPQSPYAWGCYSPYSIQDFQDWLRHRAVYVERGGAPESVTGPWVDIQGRRRSAFYDDPSPSDAGGTGLGFNEVFGTAFTSWKLEYWDLADHPPGSLPWADDLHNELPSEGQRGNFAGRGFDAPRTPDPASRFWLAWDNEALTAPGYRQHSLHAWNRDVVEDFAATGFPRERLFTHQIPAEFLGPRVLPAATYKPGTSQSNLRRFTTASPLWTADDLLGPWGGFGLGITAFDYMTDEAVFARARALDANWALLEYHPDSPGQPDYPRCMDSLRGLYRQRVHMLAPGWWGYKKPPFLLNGTAFARALKDWIRNPSGLDERDQPWDSFAQIDYAPPAVHGLRVERLEGRVRLSWGDRLWPDVRYARWSLWREWQGGVFVIERTTPGGPGREVVAEVSGHLFSWTDTGEIPAGSTYRVAARRTKGVVCTGPYSPEERSP